MNVALALEAFLSEHRRCWQLYDDGLVMGQDGAIVLMTCMGCESQIFALMEAPE